MSKPSFAALVACYVCLAGGLHGQSAPFRLTVVDPGHFHAALLQKEMYPGLDRRVSVYAPLGPELLDYLNRIALFNSRPEKPTEWELDVHCAPNPMEEMLRGKAGNVVVFSGRNRGKIDRILSSLSAGMHVLADKPWIILSADLPKLERALDLAQQKGLAAYDIMTERYEVTSQIQRVLVNAPAVFGKLAPGDETHPAIDVKSIHHIMKLVAGVPLRRPVRFFDVADSGEGLSDVGTHAVDLIQWTAFPDQAIDYRQEIRMESGRHEALPISRAQFEQITGAHDFPSSLAARIRGDSLDYDCNNFIRYRLRGVHVKLDVLWKWEAPPGTGDVYEAAFHGTRARVEVRQGAEERFLPEVYVVPERAAVAAAVFAALDTELANLQSRWPGIAAERLNGEARIRIPPRFRVTHEDHFGQVATRFFEYARSPKSMPKWERACMLAKYYVTTTGVEMSHSQ